MWVVLFHAPLIHVGSFGVDIFFVLSGFIIAHVTARDPRGFAAKRLIRVLPLYWLATLAVFAAARAAPALFAATDPSWLNLARSLLFIPYARPDGVVQPLLFLGWTLNYELLFYAIFALALAVGGTRASLVAVALLVALTMVGLAIPPDLTALHFWTRPILLEFALGIGVWRFWSAGRTFAPR
ncbi:MAG: acyltransferase, partial [Sphingomonadaceae bacterium]|nr:acyltransferase [Sphingomonadaceae bacterium]